MIWSSIGLVMIEKKGPHIPHTILNIWILNIWIGYEVAKSLVYENLLILILGKLSDQVDKFLKIIGRQRQKLIIWKVNICLSFFICYMELFHQIFDGLIFLIYA